MDFQKRGKFGYRHSESGLINFFLKEFESWPSENAFKEDKVSILKSFSLDHIIFNNYYVTQIKTLENINTPKVDEYCIFRNWVYRLLKEDMKQIFKENGESL